MTTRQSALVLADLGFPWSELPVTITNVNSGKCLDVPGFSGSNYTAVQQYSCNGGANQTWFLSRTGTGTFQVRPGHVGNKILSVAGDSTDDHAAIEIRDSVSGGQIFGFVSQGDGSYAIASTLSEKCLDIPWASTDDGVALQQYPCTGGSNQKWTLAVVSRAMNLIAKHSDKCVDVADGDTADNANVQQFACGKQSNQAWLLGPSLTSGGTTWYQLVASHSSKCMDVENASLDNWANVQQYHCTSGDNQLWQIVEGSDGYVTIINKTSGKCLDVAGGDTGNWANIQQFTCNGGDNQKFRWSIYDTRHVQIIQVADSGGNGRQTQTDYAIGQHLAKLNGIYVHSGLQLTYDSGSDKSSVNSDALYNLGYDSNTYTCPDSSTGTADECAIRYAANYPGKVVVFSRPGFGFSSGDAAYIAIGQMGSDLTPVCTGDPGGGVPDVQWLAHEFGHYMGLNHVFYDDLLADTRPDPVFDSCLAPHAATGTSGGTTVDTNNVMSYYYNDTPIITPMQSSITRAEAFARGY